MYGLTIPRATLEALAEHEEFEDNIRADYSGRGMYGRSCVAYTGCNLMLFAFRLAVEMVRVDFDEDDDDPDLGSVEAMLEALGEARIDSMGRGMIYYWPGLTVEE